MKKDEYNTTNHNVWWQFRLQFRFWNDVSFTVNQQSPIKNKTTNKGVLPLTLQYVQDSEMDNLLKMTNDVMMKIKQQTRGTSLWIPAKSVPRHFM